jgi:hypothetical protein
MQGWGRPRPQSLSLKSAIPLGTYPPPGWSMTIISPWGILIVTVHPGNNCSAAEKLKERRVESTCRREVCHRQGEVRQIRKPYSMCSLRPLWLNIRRFQVHHESQRDSVPQPWVAPAPPALPRVSPRKTSPLAFFFVPARENLQAPPEPLSGRQENSPG